MERDKKVSNLLMDVEQKRNSIIENFNEFTDGVRLMMLLERKKDGGSNKEERRVSFSKITLNKDDFKNSLLQVLMLQATIYPNHRLYLSVNARNLKKVVRDMEVSLLESHYADETCRTNTHAKLLKSPRHWLMQPKNSTTSYFILDIDNIEGRDIEGEALKKIADLGISIIKKYKTKNGWHIVTEPFNPALWDNSLGEIKKDGLILISYV